VFVEPDNMARTWLTDNMPKGFFQDWPSFGVYDHMSVVLETSGMVFLFGYSVGAIAVINAITDFAKKNPVFTVGAAAATTLFSTISPLVLNAVKYIVIGGMASGTALAAPYFVVSTSAIFVASSFYHTFQIARRLIKPERKLLNQ